MEQYEFTTPKNTKFEITNEEVSNGWLTIVKVTNKQGEVSKYAWISPYDQSIADDRADLQRIVDIVRNNY